MNNKEEEKFLDTIKEIMEYGYKSVNDRTGIGTKFLTSVKLDYDISNGKIPIWTTRKINYKNQWWELIWMLRGDTNIKFLKDRGVNIWDSWADEKGYIGPTYGKQLRSWKHPTDSIVHDSVFTGGVGYECEIVDQFNNLIEGIKSNPESRRHIISLWNAGEYANLEKPYLPSCHSNHIQINIVNGTDLHYQMIQRSSDFCIGFCPWQHALFANIIGQLTGYKPTKMSILIGNCHIYLNQFAAAKEQSDRIPTEFPTLKMNPNIKTIEDIENSIFEDYELVGYSPQKSIKFPIAV